MEFRQLRYILKIADCGNVTKAARELYVSQPSLSHFLAKTEAELGIKLFTRTNNSIMLTYAGERYVQTARQILMLSDNLKKEFNDINDGTSGRIIIGISQGRGAFMLPPILKAYRKQYPDIVLTTVEAKSEVLLEQLENGAVDMLFMPEEPLPADLMSEVIYREDLLLICSKGKLSGIVSADATSIDLQQVKDCPFVLLNKGHGIRTRCDALFQKEGISPPIVFETSSNTMALRLAAIGEGLAIVPKRSIVVSKYENELDIYKIGDQCMQWNVIAVYREQHYLSKIECALIDTAQQVFSKM